MNVTHDVVQVPLNRARFRSYRNLNAVSAALSLGMVLVILARGWCLLGGEFMHPKDPALLLFAVVAGVCVLLLVGVPIAPTWQLAFCQTRVLKQGLPALVVDHEGIQDNASNYTFGCIPWSEIESIIVTNRYARRINKTFPGVAIVLKDRNFLLRKKSKIVAMWMQSDPEISKKRQVFIPQGRLACPVEEVAQLANEWRNQNVPGRA